MPEYVKRTDALKIVDEVHGARSAYHRIRNIPAEDVVPVVHGRWIPCDPDSDVRFYCSLCGTEISTSWDYDCDEMWNGCPHCLARMDGDTREG